jgi:SWI/SNF-related matrix-associated actin-dependent regulator 1 of chromatin subfamily A
MTELQRTIYTDTLRRSRKAIFDTETALDTNTDARPSHRKSKQQKNNNMPTSDKQHFENSSNVLMDLRKAALHPMLFRTRFTDQTLTDITKQLMKEADFKKRKANFDFVKEDMEVMTDAELQLFCATYKVSRQY